MVISASSATAGVAATVAEAARELGAAVVVAGRDTGGPAAESSDHDWDVLELDAADFADHAALREALAKRWGGLDGAVHLIARTPADAADGSDPGEGMRRAAAAFAAGAYSFSAVARAVAPLMREPSGATGSVVGVSMWGAGEKDSLAAIQETLEGVNRYAACELGPRGVRVNLVVSGPLAPPVAGGRSDLGPLEVEDGREAPLGWDRDDPRPVARAACFLLSDWARGVSGDVLRVDGGIHLSGR